jgi:dolichyl-phosphate beta-glucosyltransferase
VNVVRRYVGIGAAATVLDVAIFLLGALALGWSPPLADAVAVTVATIFSFVGHRDVTFSANPSDRWFRNHIQYVGTAVTSGVLDVALLTLMTSGARTSVWWLLLGKAVSLGAAFLVRVFIFRTAMFSAIRSEQQRPRSRPAPPGEVRLSVVIPAFREEDAIASTIDRVRAELATIAGDGGLEVVVVDDGSPDDTAGRAREAGADLVVRLEQNSGKGAAVRTGMLAAHGRCVAFTDADLSYAPAQIVGLLNRIEEGWDVVVGSRKHTETRTLVENRRLREVGGRVINLFTSLVLLGQYRDTQCGLKAFRSDVAQLVFSRSVIDGFAFDVEVFHLVERYHLSLDEVPVELVNSHRSTVKVVRDATRLFRDLFRIRRRGRRGGYEVTAVDMPPTLISPQPRVA